MRIQEIISENLDEAIPGMATIGKAVSAVAKWGSKSKMMDELAAKWAQEYMEHGRRLTSVPKQFANDAEFIADTKEAAKKIVAKANRAAVGGKIVKGIRISEKVIDVATKYGFGTGAPLYTYNTRMEHWEKQLASGAISQDEFNELRQKEMSVMIGSMAGSLVGYSAAKGVLNFFAVIPGTRTLIRGAGTYAGYYVQQLIQSNEGREMVAMLFASDVAELDISPLVGGVPINIIDQIAAKFEQFKQAAGLSNKPPAQQPATGANTQQAPAQTAPATGGQQPAAAATGTTQAAAQPKTTDIIGTNLKSIDNGPNGPIDIDFK